MLLCTGIRVCSEQTSYARTSVACVLTSALNNCARNYRNSYMTYDSDTYSRGAASS
jgi:hypothetical protein